MILGSSADIFPIEEGSAALGFGNVNFAIITVVMKR